EQARQLELANALGARLAQMNDVGQIVEAAVEELNGAFGYFVCAVIRIRDEDTLEVLAARGQAAGVSGTRLTIPRSRGVVGRAIRERKAALVGDVTRDPDYFSTAPTADVASELAVPIWLGSELWGALDVQERRTDAF